MRKLLALISVALVAGLTAVIAVPALGAAPVKKVKVGPLFSFSPKSITVKRGTKMVWVWTGGLPHNLAIKTGPVKFSSKKQDTGTYTHVFSVKGTYLLICKLHVHQGMKMTIKVT
jgi:plastocyanin